MMTPKTGKGAINPLNCGPRFAAMAVTTTTKHAAKIIRTGKSQGGIMVVSGRSLARGMKYRTTPTVPNRIKKAENKESENRFKNRAERKKTQMASIELISQLNLRAARLKARQNTQTDACPPRLPAADPAAKVVPYCNASKMDIGAEVSGKPKNQPLTAGPQRLPARETRAVRTGLRNSLSVSINLIQMPVYCGELPTGHRLEHNRFQDVQPPGRSALHHPTVWL